MGSFKYFELIGEKMCRKIASLFVLSVVFVIVSGFNIFSSEGKDIGVCLKLEPNVNGGTPFYVYLKEVDKGEFLREDYEHVVMESLSSAEVQSECKSQVLIPGKIYEIRFPRKNLNKQVGIYFLFTQPGENWKLLCDPSKRVRIELGGNEIVKAHNE